MKMLICLFLALMVFCSTSPVAPQDQPSDWYLVEPANTWHLITWDVDSLFIAMHLYNDSAVMYGSVYARGNTARQISFIDSACTMPIDTGDNILSIDKYSDTLVLKTTTIGDLYFTR